MDSINKYKTHFYLRQNNIDLEIPEPVGWDGVNLTINRNRETHGFNYIYTDEGTELTFMNEKFPDLTNPYLVILNQINIHGINAEVYLIFTAEIGGVEEEKFIGLLDFSNYIKTPNEITTSVGQTNEFIDFQNRKDVKVDLESTEDLDGNTISGQTLPLVGLHNKAIRYQASNKPVNNQNSYTANYPLDGNETITFHVGLNFNQFEDNTYITQNTEPGPQAGIALGYDIFDINLDGLYHINTNAFTLTVHTNADGQIHGTVEFRARIGAAATPITVAAQIVNLGPNQTAHIPVQAYITSDELTNSDTIAFYADLQSANPEGSITVSVDADSFITIEKDVYIQERTETKSAFVHNALKQTILSVTGSDILKSDYFDPTIPGCGSNMVVARGLSIRNFTGALYVDFQTMFESLKAMFNVGYNWEDNAGDPQLRVENMEFFYQDSEIIDLGVAISDYKEEPAEEFILNKIQIGYAKYLDEDINTLDEFCTFHNYLLPLKASEEKVIQSPFIASGYAIEITRRKQFEEETTTSWQYDDDIFIFEVGKSKYFYNAEFDSTTDIITIREDEGDGQSHDISYMNLTPGANIIIYGGQSQGSLTVVAVTVFSDRTEIEVSNGAILATETISLYIGWESDYYNAKAAEDFDVVENVIDPHSSYNLKHSPKRMMLRWSPWVNSALEYLQGLIPANIIRNTFVKYNGDLTTQLNNSVACTLNDPNRLEWVEKEDIPLDIYNEDQLFKPVVHTFNVKLPFDDVETILDACRGVGANKYGYISFTDPQGNTKQGFLLQLQHDPNSLKTNFTLIEKAS